MTNRLMISVAAIALIAGTSFASAQGNMGHEGGSSAGAAAQSAPSSERGGGMERGSAERPGSAGQMNHDAGKSDMKSSQSDMQKSPGAANNQRADDNMQGSKSKAMSSENAEKGGADRNAGGKDMKAEGRDQNSNMKDAQGTDRNKMNNQAEGKNDRKSETVGQAGAGAKLSTEQRTKVTTVIKQQHVAPVTNVNFSISVGSRVPRDGVSFHPLPTEIVNVYPDWRGYEFILVRDQILVINPESLEIVAVLDA
jgi:Protein of unknown function (DUF1236)